MKRLKVINHQVAPLFSLNSEIVLLKEAMIEAVSCLQSRHKTGFKLVVNFYRCFNAAQQYACQFRQGISGLPQARVFRTSRAPVLPRQEGEFRVPSRKAGLPLPQDQTCNRHPHVSPSASSLSAENDQKCPPIATKDFAGNASKHLVDVTPDAVAGIRFRAPQVNKLFVVACRMNRVMAHVGAPLGKV